MDEKYKERCKKAKEIIPLLEETKEHKIEIEEIKA